MAENESKEVIDVTPAAENTTVQQPNAKPVEPVTPATPPSSTEPTKPVVQKERGFSHYVGFALLTFLSIVFFFIPGISAAFLINQVGELSASAAWILSAIFSAVIWLIFKLKIKGFKKASAWYIGFCGLIFVILLLV